MSKIDVLSEVFSTLRIKSELYFRAHMNGPFSVSVPQEQRRIRFHLVLHGTCWIETAGEQPYFLQEGDIALVPNGSSQVLSLEPGLPHVGLDKAIESGVLKDGMLTYGDGPERTVILCGYCRFDEDLDHPAVGDLPSLICLRNADLGGEPWVAATLKLLVFEANLNAQGTTAILSRLIEIVVIQATRRLSTRSETDERGFIAALRDSNLSRALQEIHSSPEKNWRVGDLAVLTGMSRAGFADRFTAVVGVPPIEYLTNWRLMRARFFLSETNLTLDEIAERCGYASLPSFSRRFKKSFGTGPGAYRRMAVTN
ncbi:AraC family transcriptional regulator [Desulfovibrio sp. JC010]|uniref:AraC family transcriptional regulator n=1 Tax=Desulfovibrio sp. JC010 TaxID=2593641 RepID=UPI00193F196C|nr:AraC family transcriptional regulator [Desulfovibrio sp. JC010]